MARKKVTIVGGGQTGGIMAYRLAEKNICDIVIKDVAEYAQHHGKALDIMQGGPFAGFETKVTATDEWDATAGSDVVVITSGAPRKPGMTREDLLRGNAEVVGDYAAKNAAQLSPNAIIIVFANPMDVMVHAALRATGFPRERIIGQGGMLDSSRFRTFIAMELGCSPRDVAAYVLGGHTDATMVPIVSLATVGGIPLEALISKERIEAIVQRTMNGGAELVELYKTGSAFLGPSVGTMAMVESVILDEKRLLPCAVMLQGEYGINGTVCGTILKIGAGGAEQVYEVPVSPGEKAKIVAAANSTAELAALI
ncbi:MAG TPA: malate dehydrogenase [Dehalococcoidia bacterium]|nr:malate dehydrogenase [Dehalococcoidia bacterium]